MWVCLVMNVWAVWRSAPRTLTLALSWTLCEQDLLDFARWWPPLSCKLWARSFKLYVVMTSIEWCTVWARSFKLCMAMTSIDWCTVWARSFKLCMVMTFEWYTVWARSFQLWHGDDLHSVVHCVSKIFSTLHGDDLHWVVHCVSKIFPTLHGDNLLWVVHFHTSFNDLGHMGVWKVALKFEFSCSDPVEFNLCVWLLPAWTGCVRGHVFMNLPWNWLLGN